MLQLCLHVLVFLNVFTSVLSDYEEYENKDDITRKTYAIWPNATVPFYVDPQHFDHEQSLAILTTLSMFAFKTCLKFKPVMAPPAADDEVLTFINPDGVRRCHIETKGHSVFNPHIVRLGYECLKSPQIDMMVMKALGFPFEHNRIERSAYITVLFENIEPGHIELFTKENFLPMELRFLPYDINSVMHFGTRDYSKNGHRTIIFKDHNTQQNRIGLSPTDLKKIEIVYGPECRIRDRLEKIQLCQSYPGVARRKREANRNALDEKEHPKPDLERRKRDVDLAVFVTKSLRVNPDITPPPEALANDNDITKTLQDLGIDQPVQEIVEQAYKVASLALRNARDKYCKNNNTGPKAADDVKVIRSNSDSDVLGIIEKVASFAKGMVDEAVKNLTKFCEDSETIEVYQRARGGCNWSSNDPRCGQSYFKSTKSGPVKYSTNHRPVPDHWATKHLGGKSRKPNYARARNSSQDSEEAATKAERSKRDVETTTETLAVKREGDKKKAEASERSNAGDAKEENKAEVANGRKEVTVDRKAEVNGDKKEEGVIEKKADGDEKEVETFIEKDGNMDDKSNLAHGENRRKSHKRKRHHGDVNSEDKIEEEKRYPKENERERRRPREEIGHHREVENGHKVKWVKSNQDQMQLMQVEDSVLEPSNKRNIEKAERLLANGQQKSPGPEDYDERPKRKPRRLRPPAKLPRTVQLTQKNEEFYQERRWPGGVLTYVIQDDTTYDLSDMREQLEEVREILSKRTCVRMKEVTHEQAKDYEDYIVIDNSPDYVTGRVGGEQRFGSIELFRGGQHRQHSAMMVMAMLGFYFEVSRHDRDHYIRVHMRHVRPDKLHHFEMIRSDATLALPYDYASAMHPAWQFWRQLGRTGISTVATFKDHDPNGTIMQSLGQNEKVLSELDIVKINSVYGVDCFHRSRSNADPHQRQNNETVLSPFPATRGP